MCDVLAWCDMCTVKDVLCACEVCEMCVWETSPCVVCVRYACSPTWMFWSSCVWCSVCVCVCVCACSGVV